MRNLKRNEICKDDEGEILVKGEDVNKRLTLFKEILNVYEGDPEREF